MNTIPLVILLFLLLTILVFVIALHFRKKAILQKLNTMNTTEKEEILNNLANAVGYS